MKAERFVGTAIVQLFPFIGIDVIHHSGYIFLCQVVKAGPFSGDVSYNTDSRDPEEYDPYWFGSTVAFHNGYIYMVDEDEMNIDEIIFFFQCPLSSDPSAPKAGPSHPAV